MSIEIFQVDAFAEKPFTGNPAAVCILSKSAESEWMQNVASEMNLPETAFLYRDKDGFNLRWFSPAMEVDLCGHATLASAHILWERGYIKPQEEARFHTRSGLLTAVRKEDLIELNFPVEEAQEADMPCGLAEALGVEPFYVGKNRFDYLVEFVSPSSVRELSPDMGLLQRVPTRGVIVTCLSDAPEYDFISRFFAPAAGIDEDPVTGSAHCCLGPYWMKKLGKSEFTAFQASSRGGVVHVRVNGDRVVLGGEAVTVFKGTVCV